MRGVSGGLQVLDGEVLAPHLVEETQHLPDIQRSVSETKIRKIITGLFSKIITAL